jgi:acetyl esterase/lipase
MLRTLMLSIVACVLGLQPAPADKPETPDEARATTRPDAPAAPIPLPPNVVRQADVAYLSEIRREKADLYFPSDHTAASKSSAVIVIHGGGFNDGDKARKREINIAGTLASNGYVAMSINYKLAKTKGVATWPQSVLDAKSAVRYLRANAATLGVDPDRIGVIGCSAGGNLAAMLALTQPEDGFEPAAPYAGVSSAVRCAVDLYGAVDLPNYHDMKMFAKTRAEAPELYRKASPVTYVRPGRHVPPMLLIHGTADEVVNVSQSRTLAAALASVGATHELIIIEGAPHTFDLQPKQRDLRPDVLKFFGTHLRGESAASAGLPADQAPTRPSNPAQPPVAKP